MYFPILSLTGTGSGTLPQKLIPFHCTVPLHMLLSLPVMSFLQDQHSATLYILVFVLRMIAKIRPKKELKSLKK